MFHPVTTLTRGTQSTAHATRTLAIALLVASATQAQQPISIDGISGRWTGRLGHGTKPNFPVALELRVSGATVTGSVKSTNQAGEVQRGTFDSTTGALHLELVVPAQPNSQLTLDGIVVENTAVGRVTRGDTTGMFILSRAAASTTVSESEAVISREQLQAAFDEINGNIVKATALVPDNKYNYQPTKTVRTFGQIVGHVVDAYEYYCTQATGRRAVWSDSTALGRTDRAHLAAHLDAAAKACRAAHASGNVGPLIVNLAHANLHYGNLVTYIRMLGMVPPSSR